MLRLSALSLLAAMTFTNFVQVHPATHDLLPPAVSAIAMPTESDVAIADGDETLVVYYSPLAATEVSKYVGLGLAYHMAIIYTDARGRSFGVSSGPSNLKTRQTPASAFAAMIDMANDAPSAFGTLVADPNNNTPFIIGGIGDYYTQDAEAHKRPHTLVLRGRDLSAKWAVIVATYTTIGRMHLTYSPVTQNSNSMAATALRRAGLDPRFSSETVFTPGAFTDLPG